MTLETDLLLDRRRLKRRLVFWRGFAVLAVVGAVVVALRATVGVPARRRACRAADGRTASSPRTGSLTEALDELATTTTSRR